MSTKRLYRRYGEDDDAEAGISRTAERRAFSPLSSSNTKDEDVLDDMVINEKIRSEDFMDDSDVKQVMAIPRERSLYATTQASKRHCK
jgi:hypothetical protein